MKLSKSLDQNMAIMNKRFERDKTVKIRPVEPRAQDGSTVRMCLYFCDGMVSSQRINDSILRPINRYVFNKDSDLIHVLETAVLEANEVAHESDMDNIAYSMLYGDTVLLCEGFDEALVLNTKGFAMRSISEPDGEMVLKGPREGFSEAILLNLSLLRRKIRSSDLKFEYLVLGSESKTTCCLCYLDGIVDQKVLAQVRKRLDKIEIDSILGSNYVAELIRDCWWTPFKTIGTTERPDSVAAKLLEGRVALVVDGTPVVITMPHILMEDFQTSEDYYISFQFATISRFLRMVGFFLAISIVPLYVALITWHPEMLPTSLLFSISAARDGVPFPTLLEALVLLFTFDILREAGMRTPSMVGSALSIVGALVLGSSAVEARFVSAPMVIIIAFSAITGLIIPKLSAAVIVIRLALVVLASQAGLYGWLLGLSLLLLHLCWLESFGVSYLVSSPLSRNGSHEDSLVRAPFRRMKKQGRFLSRGGRGKS